MSLQCCLMHVLITIVITAISFVCSTSSFSIETDRMALLALKDGFTLGGTPSNNSALNSWNSSLHICDWKGITCGRRHKRVMAIELGEQKLNGILSPWIGNLSLLRVLNLTDNLLHGEIPKQIGNLGMLQFLELEVNSFEGRIPNELSNCSNLIEVYLTRNKLTGLIPFQLGSLSKITAFYVRRNYLIGEIPSFWRNFSSLTKLHIGVNKFHGEIGDSLLGLWKLEILGLNTNNFTGIIPPYVYNFSSLVTLELKQNNFTGTLPKDIDVAFPKLVWLNLVLNSFTGTIPSALSNISGLHHIQMISNKFVGSVPDRLGNLKSLRVLALDGNSLGGGEMLNDLRFIDSLSNCTKLEWVNLDSNRFVGPIPNSVGNLSYNLEFLLMGNNYITGSIPEEMGKLYGLSWVDFSGNMLTGNIPDSIGKLSNIFRLNLSNNKLHGAIPSSIGKLKGLLQLRLSANLFEGTITWTLGNCTNMQIFDISSNHFDGYLPGSIMSQFENLIFCNISHNFFDGGLPLVFEKIRSLRGLDASYNNFSGEIPAQLDASLEYLSLAGNSFRGNIPASLSDLRGLTWLDLSSNNLSGPIPKELASLVFIQNLNLSFNQLEGDVPLFRNVSGVSVVGNNKLCGGNPELQLRLCFVERKRRNISQKIIIVATISTFAFLSLLVLLLTVIYYRRKHIKENAYGIAERHRRITYIELFEATNGFAISNLIGTGSFGDVFKGNLDGDESKTVAVKVLNVSKRGAKKNFIAECEVLRSTRHKNLLRIITSCSSLDHKGDDFMALVFDYMSNGNLDSWLHINQHQGERESLTLAKRLDIAIDVGWALNYLHSCCEPPIIHCDLKPSNILLDHEMIAHVGDFGLAKVLYGGAENKIEGETLSAAIKGTVGYIAPEYGMGATISPEGDIYSYGILLLELIIGRRPTDEMFNNELNLRSFVERAIPDQIEEIVDKCLVDELNEAMTNQTNPEHYKLQWHTSLLSFVEVGISCSSESPKERMDIQSAVNCILKIKKTV